MRLRESFQLMMKSKPISKPNPGFIYQLMEYDKQLFGDVSLSWDDVPAFSKTLLGWLQTNAVLNNAKESTHLWWDVFVQSFMFRSIEMKNF